MSAVKELLELEKILKKDPIINTATWEELSASPDSVAKNYRKHAMTHMSLGDAQDYETKMIKRLVNQHKVFSGLVTGDFGLGKTSMLVYLWHKAEERGLMAVPPFSWRSLDELFSGITTWVSYMLEQKNLEQKEEFNEIASQFQKRGMKKEVKLLVSNGMSEEKAQQFVENKIKEGSYRLDRTIAEFLQFCDRITAFLVECGYEGLMIFTDELQITLNELAPEKVFQYLFELSNSTMNREGRYGIMMGLPLNSFVQMQQVKSDALDRFKAQKMLIDLSKIYTSDFAVQLWEKYATYFGFEDLKDKIIDSYAIKSLGELTDSSRKDIGNGPRSVISAFNAIVKHFHETQSTYTVLDLVEDCMNDEILLGERSHFVATVQSLVEKVERDSDFSKVIYTLAAFPQGCKPEVLSYYQLINNKTQTLLNEWVGNEIRQSMIEGYRLVALDQVQAGPQSFLDQAIKDFLRYYQANGVDAKENAVKSFNEAIVPELLTDRNELLWTCLFDQITDEPIEFESVGRGIYTSDLGGTYSKVKDRFPNRHLLLVTMSSLSENIVPKSRNHDTNFIYTGKWVFYLDLDGKGRNMVVKQSTDDYTYAFTLNVKTKIEAEIPLLSELVPFENTDAQLLLNLIHYLNKTGNIPTSEQQELEYIISEMVRELITALFDVTMKDVQFSDWKLRNHGKSILIEMFEKMCEERFPEYRTLMVGNRWKQRMTYFKAFLESENNPLAQKRGVEPVAKIYQRLTAKQKKDIVSLFTLGSVGPFDQLMTDYPSLISVHDDDHLYLNIHPAEKRCIDLIENSPEELEIEGKKTKAIDLRVLQEELLQLGYTGQERMQVFEFANLRKLFFLSKARNKFYIKPLTIEEWKINLESQLQYVESLATELELQGQKVTVKLGPIQAQIERMRDEETYEQLSGVMKDVQFRLQTDMSLYVNKSISTLEDKLRKSGRVLSDLDQKLRELDPPEGPEKAHWMNFKESLFEGLRELQDQYAAITSEKAKLHKTQLQDFSEARNGVEFFVDCTSRLEEVHRNWDDLKPARKDLETKVEEWAKWQDYFNERQGLEDLIDRLKTMGLSHLIDQIESVDHGVQDEWVNAENKLPSYHVWIRKLREVREDILKELQKSRKQFEEEKQSYQQVLTELDIRQSIRTQFREDEQSKSYEELKEEFESIIIKQLDQWLDQTESFEQRLRYYTEVLEIDVEAIENHVMMISSDLFKASTKLKQEINLQELEDLKNIPDRINKAKRLVSKAVQKGELTKKEAEVLEAIEGQSSTLEDLILRIAEQTDTFDLEEILRIATNLFKKNHINIKIEKGGE
jgi:hypothetical protein